MVVGGGTNQRARSRGLGDVGKISPMAGLASIAGQHPRPGLTEGGGEFAGERFAVA